MVRVLFAARRLIERLRLNVSYGAGANESAMQIHNFCSCLRLIHDIEQMLSVLTIIHPLVDACSVSVLVVGGMTWERVIAYNAMAFALQLPIGAILDELPHLNRCGFFVGTGLTFSAAVAAALGFGGWYVLSAACIGNALFHLTAGKRILETREGRSGPISGAIRIPSRVSATSRRSSRASARSVHLVKCARRAAARWRSRRPAP